jgi:hypothetical protein
MPSDEHLYEIWRSRLVLGNVEMRRDDEINDDYISPQERKLGKIRYDPNREELEVILDDDSHLRGD